MDDEEFIKNMSPARTYVAGRFHDGLSGRPMRIARKVDDTGEAIGFAKIGDHIVLRASPGGRRVYRATFFEDDRSLQSILLQQFKVDGSPNPNVAIALSAAQVSLLIEFIGNIKIVDLPSSGGRRFDDKVLREVTRPELEALVMANQRAIAEIASSDVTEQDIIALGYRRAQLERFEKLMEDPHFFRSERERLEKTPEGLWQAFFEENRWIFGYGLSYQFLSGLDGKKLEQVVRGASIHGPGKRGDALMKTEAIVSSMCFVEIKRHDTVLLGKEYRSGAWQPSEEMSGAVAQVQATVQTVVEDLRGPLDLKDQEGNPTGERLFGVAPKAVLIAGRLDEFMTPKGANNGKVNSFELFRRNVRSPEILTFDELYNRARFIVEHQA